VLPNSIENTPANPFVTGGTPAPRRTQKELVDLVLIKKHNLPPVIMRPIVNRKLLAKITGRVTVLPLRNFPEHCMN
jgi:hypothetical protein